jgi:hypothetical protein
MIIQNWRDAWKLISVQIGVVGAAASGYYAEHYDTLSKVIPPQYMAYGAVGLFAMGVIGRIVAQPSVTGSPTINDVVKAESDRMFNTVIDDKIKNPIVNYAAKEAIKTVETKVLK